MRLGSLVLLLPLAVSAASCRSASVVSTARVVQPGAPGEASRPAGAGPAPVSAPTAADITFMQGMIGHHAQALEMTELLRTRTSRDDLQLLAKRIDVSQTDEIKMMRRWLESKRQPAPDSHAMHMPGATLMPGMLTADEMGRLSAAKGAGFDRLFLEFMIKHHEGALVMVKELFDNAGAAQEAEVFAFASDVLADQRMEIDRMRGMLAGMR